MARKLETNFSYCFASVDRSCRFTHRLGICSWIGPFFIRRRSTSSFIPRSCTRTIFCVIILPLCLIRSSVGLGYPTFWCPQGWVSRQERLSLRASKSCAGRTGISTVWKANSSATWTSTGQRGRCHYHTPSSRKLMMMSFEGQLSLNQTVQSDSR